MTHRLQRAVLLVLFSLCFSLQNTQAQRPQRSGGEGRNMPAIARVYGRVLDASTNDPVPYASVVVLQMHGDSILGGGLTRENGDFDIEKLPFGPKRLKITFLGYSEKIENIVITPKNMDMDLGNFRLEADADALSEVTIEGQKSAVQLGIDRRIYNVDNNLAAIGGTAVDALKVIPSIEVDVEGNVTMRNGSPRIFLDGKPTELTLEQIPAQEIDRIEVITNPSVKYSATTTAGIINVVLKKSKMPGLFGMLSLGIGQFDRYNVMGNLSFRQGRTNFNMSYGLRTGRGPVNEYNYRDNLDPTTGALTSLFYQDTRANNSRTFQFGRIGIDYSIDNRNTLSLSNSFMLGDMEWPTNQMFWFGNEQRDTTLYGTRTALGQRRFFNVTPQIEWRRTYPTEGKEWTTFINWNPSRSAGETNVDIETMEANGSSIADSPERLTTDGELRGNVWQFQSDFIQPKGENAKWETGLRGQYRNSENLTDAFRSLGPDGDLQRFPLLENNYSYEEVISAAYYNYSGRWGVWGYQVGLRFEQSWFEGRVPGTDSSFSYAYPNGFENLQNTIFPALYLSKKVGDSKEWQINISRKLERPNFWQLMPFIWQQDNQNYRSGNPNLTPEFRYIGEANYSDAFKKGSWLSSLYGRYEDNPINRVVFPINDGSGALVNTYVNGQSQVYFGWEQTFKYTPLKWLDLTLGTDINRTQVKASFEGQDYSNTGWNWRATYNAEVRFPYQITFQTNGSYRAPRVEPQGTSLAQYSIDLGLSKKFGQIGTLTLSVNDLFNTDGRGSLIETPFYTQESWGRRQPRFVQLTASIRFGKPDAKLFRNMRGRSGSGGGDGEGGFEG